MKEPQQFSDRHGIRQEELIVLAESMSLGLKVETNGLGLPQLGAQPICELIGLSKKEPCCSVVVFVNHL